MLINLTCTTEMQRSENKQEVRIKVQCQKGIHTNYALSRLKTNVCRVSKLIMKILSLGESWLTHSTYCASEQKSATPAKTKTANELLDSLPYKQFKH